jgi:hypothetical protein
MRVFHAGPTFVKFLTDAKNKSSHGPPPYQKDNTYVEQECWSQINNCVLLHWEWSAE